MRKYVEAQEGANEEGEEEDNAEEQRGDVKYYKVEAEVTIKTEDEEEPNKTCYDFIVRTKDVDTAKVVITAWIDSKVKERTEKDGDERKIVEIFPYFQPLRLLVTLLLKRLFAWHTKTKK